MENTQQNNENEYIVIPNPIYDDEYLAELIRRDNEIVYFKEQFQKTPEELEKERLLRIEKDKVLKEKNKVLEEKNKMIINLAKTLKENNIPIEIIIEKTN